MGNSIRNIFSDIMSNDVYSKESIKYNSKYCPKLVKRCVKCGKVTPTPNVVFKPTMRNRSYQVFHIFPVRQY